MSRVGIITVGLSNVSSLTGALSRAGASGVVVDSPIMLGEVDRLIIPGVGNFSRAMTLLKRAGLVSAIKDFASSGRPVMGICLGMQLLASKGQEGDGSDGLGLVSGNAALLPSSQRYRVPHMGWNSIDILRPHPVLESIASGTDFYFVHSYAVSEFKPCEELARTNHGNSFMSATSRENVVGFQFHPEKSQKQGSRIINNFLNWDGKC